MTDRPNDPRYVDPAYADPADDPNDPRYVARPTSAQHDVADDRPRVVRDDGTVVSPGEQDLVDPDRPRPVEPGSGLPPGYRPFDESTVPGTATADRAVVDPTTGDPVYGDRTVGQRAVIDPATGQRAVTDPATGDRTVIDPTTRERTIDDGVPVRDGAETDPTLVAPGPHGRPSIEERARTYRATPAVVTDATLVREREEDAMGGIKWGSAFFGWLAAMGVAAILTALLAAAGTALALNNPTAASTTTDLASSDAGTASTIGLTGAVAVLVIMFVAYLAGGYVAGRMARIDGPRQGLGVWIWMIVMAVVAALVATLAGTAYDVLGRLNTFPRIPIDGAQLATVGVITLVLAALVSLAGALLGGAAGMRYHRRMDAVGLGVDRAAVA